jgi:hypothetical protein
MAYQNNWSFRGRPAQGNTYFAPAPFAQGAGNVQFKKRSGSKKGQYANKGKIYKKPFVNWVNGWRVVDRSLVKYFCKPASGANWKTGTSQNGKVWETWNCTITYKDGTQEVRPCLHYPATGKVIVKNGVDIVLNPSAPNGGYCGPFYQRKRR